MSRYEITWPCCGDTTVTDAWEPSECPFCNSAERQRALAAPAAAEEAAQRASEYDNPTCEVEMERRTRRYWAEFDALAATPAPEAAPETDDSGLTAKEAWWAGAREGLVLPADTPRFIVGQRLSALRQGAEAAPTAALMQISDLLSSMFSGARAHVRGEDEEVVGYTVRNGALHKIVGILASYKPVIIPANLPKAHETITGLLCGTSEAAPSAKEGEADTARLDWIVRQGDEFSCSVIVDAPGDGEYRVYGMDNAYGQGKTARKAIDAAIEGLTPAGGDR